MLTIYVIACTGIELADQRPQETTSGNAATGRDLTEDTAGSIIEIREKENFVLLNLRCKYVDELFSSLSHINEH